MTSTSSTTTTENGALARVLGVRGAVLMGLGSILGAGALVSLGLALRVGPAVWGAGLALIALGLLWRRVAAYVRDADRAG